LMTMLAMVDLLDGLTIVRGHVPELHAHYSARTA